MGCCGRGGLRFGQNCVGHGVLFAREPDVASGNPLCRMSTRYLERGRGCPGSYWRVNVRIRGVACEMVGSDITWGPREG